MERSILILGNFLNLSIQFRRGRLINTAGLVQTSGMYSFKNTEHAKCVHITCILSSVKGYLYMGLCRKVVDFIWLDLKDNADDAGRIRKVSLMNDQLI